MPFRQRVHDLLSKAAGYFKAPPVPEPAQQQQQPVVIHVHEESFEDARRRRFDEIRSELLEAATMAGSAPWLPETVRGDATPPTHQRLRETNPLVQGAYGDIELALNNVEWRREINMSAIELSRWGIQQIILISRLYYLKNPIVRRLVDVCAGYVFARGVDVSSPHEVAQAAIKDFFDQNGNVLGQNALVDLERRKDYDGNLFFVFFPDLVNTGRVKLRTIDATEIMDIYSDPNDAETPQFYRRLWQQRTFNMANGQVETVHSEALYPAIGYQPTDRPATVNGVAVMWESPIYHRKCGTVAKWQFGCPRVYPMVDWSRTAREYLEDCATIARSLAQFLWKLKTKGGQAAVAQAKAGMQTGVAAPPGNNLYDKNPTANPGSIFVSGTGTDLDVMSTKNAGADPEKVRQYKLMCCMVKGVPETFLADVSTGNLATAASLDRPTETTFMELQESWVEDLTAIVKYVLGVSLGAPGGRLREAAGVKAFRIADMAYTLDHKGRRHYRPMSEAERTRTSTIEVRVEFPAIREGDIPQLVASTVEAMTLANKGGQVVGIDEREGVRKLGELLGVENNNEVIAAMYPDSEYDPDRTQEELPAPLGKLQDRPGGEQDRTAEPPDPAGKMLEASRVLREAAKELR